MSEIKSEIEIITRKLFPESNEYMTQLKYMEKVTKFLYYENLTKMKKIKMRLRYVTLDNMPIDVLRNNLSDMLRNNIN